MSRKIRTAVTGITLAAFAATTFIGPAEARSSRRNDEAAGAALVLGIGALIAGSIIANKSRRDRHRSHYEYRHAPRYHPAPQVHRAPAHPRGDARLRERFND